MKGDIEYLVDVDGVDKETICNPSKTAIRSDAYDDIGRENDIISKILFLGDGNPGSNKCSVILHMPNKREADHLTMKMYMEFGDELVFTRKCMPRTTRGPLRCFRCQRIGDHKARDCPKQPPTRGNGHMTETCTSATTRCINCSGQHRANARRFPAFVSVVKGFGQSSNV